MDSVSASFVVPSSTRRAAAAPGPARHRTVSTAVAAAPDPARHRTVETSMLSPIVMHRPYGGSGSSCQPATFATAVPIDSWLELEVSTADELRGSMVKVAVTQLGLWHFHAFESRSDVTTSADGVCRSRRFHCLWPFRCGLVYACPDQEQLGRLCTNASLSVTAMVAKRIKGRAVLVGMSADWRPWYVQYSPLFLPLTTY